MIDLNTVCWDRLFHQQNLQLYGVFVPDLDTYYDTSGVKMFREFRLQFSDSTSYFDPVSLKIPAKLAADTPYSFRNEKLLYKNEELNLSNTKIFRIPIPPEESSWHLKGYTFPYRGSKNPYREMRVNLKISGFCPGHCFFCHRTHSYRVKVPHKYVPKPRDLFEQVKISEGADIFSKITRLMFISELYGSESGFLTAIKETSDALLAVGYPVGCEFNCCATDVRSMDGLIKLREMVRPNYFSFSLEFFHNREQWMGRYKGMPINQVYSILENARKAGFNEIQLNYLAGIDTLEECELGFSALFHNGLVDSIGLSTFTIFAEDEYDYRLADAWNVKYYQQLVDILNSYHIKAYHPDAFDMGCPYTALLRDVQMIQPEESFSGHLVRLRVAGLIEKSESIVVVFDPVYRGGCWILPGGGAEFEETMSQAVEREVLEETGLNVCAEEICGLRDIWEPEKDLPERQGIRKSLEILFTCKYLAGDININNNPSIKWDGIPRVRDCRWLARDEIHKEIDGYPLYPIEFFEAYLSGQLERVSLNKILLPHLDLRP